MIIDRQLSDLEKDDLKNLTPDLARSFIIFNDRYEHYYHTINESIISGGKLIDKYDKRINKVIESVPKSILNSIVMNRNINTDSEYDTIAYSHISLLNNVTNKRYWEIYKVLSVKYFAEENNIDHITVFCNNHLKKYYNQILVNHIVIFSNQHKINVKNFDIVLFFYFLLKRINNFINNLLITRFTEKSALKNLFQASQEKSNVFFSWYPRMWRETDGKKKDYYFGSLFDEFELNSSNNSYAIRLNDNLLKVSYGLFKKRINDLIDQNIRKPLLIEQLVSFRDIVSAYKIDKSFLKYFLFIKKIKKEGCFNLEGIDFYNIFKFDIYRSACVEIPELRLLYEKTKRLTEQNKPNRILLYCFEFLYGRAICKGAHDGGCKTVIGVQHGVWSQQYLRSKLFFTGFSENLKRYNPDFYLTDAFHGSQILVDAGVDKNRILEVGPLRYESFLKNLKNSSPNFYKSQKPILLVTPGHSDALSLFNYINDEKILNKCEEVLFKLHPKTSSSFIINDRFPSQFKILRDTALSGLYIKSDVMIATYSSTALEAIMYGLPVILVRLNNQPDFSIFNDYNSIILKCYSSAHIIEALDKLKNADFRKDYIAKLKEETVERVFKDINSSASRIAYNLVNSINE